MSCPPEHVIAAFADGQLSAPEREQIELHLDGCSDCGRVVADLARIWSDRELVASAPATTEATRPGDVPETPPELAVLRAGTSVGRYRVLECVGMGGMGVVYGAYDPELDRRIALKLLRGRGLHDIERSARLQREAQAMARLAHPNVIAVYDVGTHREGDGPPRVFVAMEFVRGCTLGAWVRTKKRSWAELREVMLAAGRGLAAAHDAGLVHRDFKPDNVLVGDDGRVRVTDFGLARLDPSRSTDDDALPVGTPSGPVAIATQTGALLGTPAYMAPEQYGGGEVDAAADQFAFCVTLFEAAYGVRPFGGKTLAELAANVCEGKLRPVPPGRELPSRVHAAIVRGLASEPRDRFPGMHALLAEIGVDPRRTMRRLGLATLGVLGIVGAAASLAGDDARGLAFCRDEGDVRTQWQKRHRDEVPAALGRTGAVYADATAETAVARLDEWVARFETEREAVCEADGALSDDPDVSTVLLVQCLRRQRAAFDAAVEVLEQSTADTIAGAAATIDAIGHPARCRDEPTIDLPPAPPAEIAEDVERARRHLVRAETLVWGSKFDEADAEIARAGEIAEAIAFPPLSAEVKMWMGRVLAVRGDPIGAAALLEEAGWSAVEAHDRRLAVKAFTALVYAEGTVKSDIEAARRAARAARAELRASGSDPLLEGNLLLNEGASEIVAGEYERASAAFRDALATGGFDDRPMSRADLLVNLGAVASELDDFDEALEKFDRARTLYETQVGPRHPAIGSVLFDIGATLYRKSDYEGALVNMHRAAEIEEETLPPGHPTHANTLAAIGTVLAALERGEESLVYLRQAVQTLEAAGEGQAATLALHRVNLGSALYELGRYTEAHREVSRGHTELVAHLGPDHVQVATAESLLGSIAHAQGDDATAETHLRRALELRQALYPATHADILYTQVELAEILAARGRSREVIDLLEDVLKMHPQSNIAPGEVAWARFLLAHAELASGDIDEESARPRIDAAVAELRALSDHDRLSKAEAWRTAAHARTTSHPQAPR